MSALVAESVNIEEMIAEEAGLSPGTYEVRFYLSEAVSEDDIAETRNYLISQGVDVKRVYQGKTDGLWYLGVRYKKSPPSDNIAFLPAAVIPLIAFSFVAVLVGIGIFKVEDIVNNLGKLLLIGLGGTIVIVALAKGPAERIGKEYALRR